jgi:hypothetical protein
MIGYGSFAASIRPAEFDGSAQPSIFIYPKLTYNGHTRD